MVGSTDQDRREPCHRSTDSSEANRVLVRGYCQGQLARIDLEDPLERSSPEVPVESRRESGSEPLDLESNSILHTTWQHSEFVSKKSELLTFDFARFDALLALNSPPPGGKTADKGISCR